MKKSAALAIIYYLLLLMLYVGASQAASVTLAWDANTEPDLANYTIYRNTVSGEYGEGSGVTAYVLTEHPEMWHPDCGPVYDPFKTECCEITIYDLDEGDNYFVATASDDELNESAYSEELVHFVKPPVNNPTRLRREPDDP